MTSPLPRPRRRLVRQAPRSQTDQAQPRPQTRGPSATRSPRTYRRLTHRTASRLRRDAVARPSRTSYGQPPRAPRSPVTRAGRPRPSLPRGAARARPRDTPPPGTLAGRPAASYRDPCSWSSGWMPQHQSVWEATSPPAHNDALTIHHEEPLREGFMRSKREEHLSQTALAAFVGSIILNNLPRPGVVDAVFWTVLRATVSLIFTVAAIWWATIFLRRRRQIGR